MAINTQLKFWLGNNSLLSFQQNTGMVENESSTFPWITKEAEAKILATAEARGSSQYEKNLIAQDLYKEALNEQNSINFANSRQSAKQDLYKKSTEVKDKSSSNWLRTTERSAEVADMIRNYISNNGMDSMANLEKTKDQDIIERFVKKNPDYRKEIEEYINGDEWSFNFNLRMWFGAGETRSRFSTLTNNDWGERNDDILGHFGTESYYEAWESTGSKIGTWFKNLWKSTRNLASDLVSMVANPIDTINNIWKMAVWGVMNLFNLDKNLDEDSRFAQANQVADGVWDYLKDRYGGLDQIKNTLYQDPAGLISDIAGIVAGWSGLVKWWLTAVAKGSAKAGLKWVARTTERVANTAWRVSKVATALDPAVVMMNWAGKTAKMASKVPGAVVDWVKSTANKISEIPEWGAKLITKTTTAQDKLFKAQEPRMNILTRSKDLEKRRLNSDRANQLIVENGYKPTDTSSRLTAHEATMKKKWKEIENKINGGEEVRVSQNQLAQTLHEYISEQKKLWSSFNKADIEALQKEMKALEWKTVDLPTLEKKKQLYNSIINNWWEQKVSDVFANWIKKLTHEIGEIEDAILAEIPGEFQKLKNDFWALADTYEDVFKADLKNQRKKWVWLTESYSRIEGIGDMLDGALSIFNGGWKNIIKWAGKLIMWKSLQKAKDLDFLVKEWFENLANEYKNSLAEWRKNMYNWGNDILNPNQLNNGEKIWNSTRGNGGLQEGGDRILKEWGNEWWGIWKNNQGKILNDGWGVWEKVWRSLLNQETNTSKIVENLERIKNNQPDGYKMDIHSAEDYANYKTFQFDDGKSSVSIKPDGDITSLVSEPGLWRGQDLILKAIDEWGNKLDCYEQYLPGFYSKAWFKPVARVKFNPEYAPADRKGPGQDIIVMMKDDWLTASETAGKRGEFTSSKKLEKELQNLPIMEYDEALKYRDMLLEESKQMRSEIKDNLPKYQEAKVEYDKYLDWLANDLDGIALNADLKILNSDWSLRSDGISRVIDKARKKTNWINGVTDIVRGTVVVKDQAWMDRAVSYLEKQWVNFERKLTNLWYSDISFTHTTKNWVVAEVQINVPEMIVAKEWKNAIKMWAINGSNYNKLIKKAGVEWWLGHKYYEEYRDLETKKILSKGDEIKEIEKRMKEIEWESQDYYSKFVK